MELKEWFAAWFDTPYYHLLYQHRSEEEAQACIERLVKFLDLEPQTKVLDLACGKGRHARTLHALDLQVLGTDLSSESISFAQKSASDGLRFHVHDMREPLPNEKFGAVFNLFTSFGYFDDTSDNQRVIDAIAEMLLHKGILVIDFLNAQRVRDTLVASEVVQRGTITFEIQREISHGKVVKQISFTDQGQRFQYQEQVQLLQLTDFRNLLQSQFQILHAFGDYALNAFESASSPRLILIATKK
jgi:cyclopropane fatty-acyl-phospholipid synthase-like methyltransferase